MKKHISEVAKELGVSEDLLFPIADKHDFVEIFEAITLASAKENSVDLADFDDYEDPDAHRVEYFEALEKVEKAKLLNLKRKQLEGQLIEMEFVEHWVTERGLLLRESLMNEINTIVSRAENGENLRALLKEHFTAILEDPFNLKALEVEE